MSDAPTDDDLDAVAAGEVELGSDPEAPGTAALRPLDAPRPDGEDPEPGEPA